MADTSVKYAAISRKLEDAIASGELLSGEQLPAEQDLARQFGVSYMTVRRAVQDLVARDLVERRSRKGTFVRHRLTRQTSKPILNLVTSTYTTESIQAFLTTSVAHAEKQDWRIEAIRLMLDQQDSAVQAIRRGDPTFVLLDEIRPSSSLALSMRAAKGTTVCFHRDLSGIGVPSILTDPRKDFQLAIDALRVAGHRNIAFVVQTGHNHDDNTRASPGLSDQLAAISSVGIAPNVIAVKTPLFHSPLEPTHYAVTAALRDMPELTGLITIGSEILLGTVSACRDLGRPVPTKTSVICYMDSPVLKHLDPKITCVDYGIDNHVSKAVEIVNAAKLGRMPEQLLYVTESRLILRDSVRECV